MIIPEHPTPDLWGPGKVDYHGTYYICLILSNILYEITGFMCSFPAAKYMNVNTSLSKYICLSIT